MEKQEEIIEKKQEEIINKRTEKIINWFKNPYNLAFFSIIVFAIAVRLYFFILIKNQPVWWDESEFLNMAKSWALGVEYLRYDAVRPILFSLVTALFFKISLTEFLPRFFVLVLSVISVIGVYYLGKELYNEKIGLLSSFFASVFYLNLFFTYRLLMDMPALAFFTFGTLFFYKYFKYKSNKLLYIGAVLISIGTLFKQSTAFILLAFFLYFLTTEKLNFLKKKEIWIAALIFVAIQLPYIIWGYIKFKGFVFTQATKVIIPQGVNHFSQYFFVGYQMFNGYLQSFPFYFSWVFLIIFVLGLLSMYKLILGFDILIKNKDESLNRDWFVLLILIAPLIVTSILIGHTEDRYLLSTFSIIFIISSMFILKIYNYIKKYNKIIAIIFLVFLLSFNIYIQIFSAGHANDLIESKSYSYLEIKNAGLWLKENSAPTDVIATQSIHQIEYYSDRRAEVFPANSSVEFEALMQKNPNLKYYMVSLIQRSPDWTYSYPQNNNLTLVNAYFADQAQQQPILLIYKL
jgi:4-amino-4-deoxy-L-arabinose transferase-like glycosyltransferase